MLLLNHPVNPGKGDVQMLYKKNHSEKLDAELFKNPTSEYRGTPFWAWNCRLEREELEWQIETLQKMGFGGFHMHVRTGMDTPYLSDEYMHLIRACVDKAKSENMLAWLYDEDRWPSGAAGGLVTKDVRYRERYMRFTPHPYKPEELCTMEHGGRGSGKLLSCYDVHLSEDGHLLSAVQIGESDSAEHEKWYAYLETPTTDGWYNNQTYVNTLSKEAIDRFIEITYESYNRTIPDEFDKTVPAIFTDEPQFYRKKALRYAEEKADITMPWSDDLAETYQKACGLDLIAGIPELVWELPDGKVSPTRYYYHDHVCERFTEAFADNCGKWCREHNIKLTGHMMEEPTLLSQTAALGEAMRAYRGFDLPGIDMLCAKFELTTAKQTQSAVHQYGYEGMLSELYGVTNWDFDFRSHKLHGDWQAALGVTVRVPHLSWVSMAGEAKRDYPASINYQSPWWDQYSLVEDHFSRVNTALTRGTPVVRIGVIHPIESYWLHWGPADQTCLVREGLDEAFQNVTKWLVAGNMDFDFISESLLPSLCEKGSAPLKVGKMEYDTILVPCCETLRSTTLERLEAFRKAGGRLIFMGKAPTLENALPSERGAKLYAESENISVDRGSLLCAVESHRIVDIRDHRGAHTVNLLHQLRKDGDGMWLFIAHCAEPASKDVSGFLDTRIRIKGTWKPTLYNTMTGETQAIAFEAKKDYTELCRRIYDYDSLLLYLEPCAVGESFESDVLSVDPEGKCIPVPAKVPYTLSEPNVMLLDKAEFCLDDGEWQPTEELLRLDTRCRLSLGWPTLEKRSAQPWVIPEETPTHTLHLRVPIHSEIDYTGALLAVERAATLAITFNGVPVDNKVLGWYTDKAIHTVALPPIHKGENILCIDLPFGKRISAEWMYLLGDFGVKVSGSFVTVTEKPDKLGFSSITEQGLPFYGGNVTYHMDIESDGGEVMLKAAHYRGAVLKAGVDGNEAQFIAYPPYKLSLGKLPKGAHRIDLTLYGHRRNGFGPVHNANLAEQWIGPGAWRTDGDRWTYEYRICEEGVLTTPIVTEK